MFPEPFGTAPGGPPTRPWLIAGVIGVIAFVLGGNGGGAQATVAVAARETATPSPASALPSVAASAAPGRSAAAPSAPPAPASGGGAAGIVFGEPVAFGAGEALSILVPVRNTSDRVKSFTVKATYTAGGQTATASGTVGDLLPGQRRAARLVAEGAAPTSLAGVRVEVAQVTREAATTPASQVAPKITFGQPQERTAGGFKQLEVAVTNGDSAPHTFGLQVAYFEGDKLVGVATGLVNEIGGGQSAAATLILQGSTTGTPSIAIDGPVR